LISEPVDFEGTGRRKTPGCTKLSVKIARVTMAPSGKRKVLLRVHEKRRQGRTEHIEVDLCANDATGPSSGEFDEPIDGTRGQILLNFRAVEDWGRIDTG
jgi:hypothetical protein